MAHKIKMDDRLMKPSLNGELRLHYVYVIEKKATGERLRVKPSDYSGGVYLLNIVDDRDCSTVDWIMMTHFEYCLEYFLQEAVTSKQKLDELSRDFKPTAVSY